MAHDAFHPACRASRHASIQGKLDELLHASGKADNKLTRLDDKEPEEIEQHRAVAREGD
jgi:low affinity Fe/Cu permease